MGEDDWKWPTPEEFRALQALVIEGTAKPIAELIREQAPAIHPSIADSLEDLNNWRSRMRWLITPKPKDSIERREEVGRPPKREIDPFYDMKMARLAMKVGQVHIEVLQEKNRSPRKVEIREAVLADDYLSVLVGFKEKKRTAQDAMIAKAHDLLMNAPKKTVG